MYFHNLVAQNAAKRTLSLYINAYKQEGLIPPDTLLSGPSGVGKSTIARQYARELDMYYSISDRRTGSVHKRLAFFEINSQVTKNITDLFIHLTEDYELEVPLENNKHTLPPCIIFIDEAHKMHSVLRTQLLSALDEERKIDFKTGYITTTLDFRNVTVIIATTDLHNLERALINRFELIELKPYSIEDIAQMVVERTQDTNFLTKEFNEKIAEKVVKNWAPNLAHAIGVEIGHRAKTVMRKAVKDLKNLIVYFTVNGIAPSVNDTLNYYKDYKAVDGHGLDNVDVSILEIIANGNLGIKSIAARLGKSEKEIEERISWLEHIKYCHKAGSGRAITQAGLERIGLNQLIPVLSVNNELQSKLSNTMKRPTEAFKKAPQFRTPEEKKLISEYQKWYNQQRKTKVKN